ncbi:tail fiber protein [Hafnia phage yong3]|nr:tail fiber protein [Hafnia phage yong3]
MPPAIIGAVIAVGAAGAAAASFITITTALVIGAVATAAGALLTKKPSVDFSAYKNQQERKQVLRASASAKVVVYGKIMGSGLLAFAEEEAGSQDDKEKINLVLVLAGHPLNDIGDIYLGDDLITSYMEHVSYEWINDPTTVNQYLLKNCPSWKSDMIGKGLSYLRITLKFNQEKFPSGLPNIRVVKYGWKVYDPRTGKTQYSNNAALVILHYYRHYLKRADSEINWEQFKVAANISDELVSVGTNGEKEPRYTINGEFDIDEPSSKILDAMFEACGGEPTFEGGKHGMLVGAYYGPADLEIDESFIAGDIRIVPETSYKERINTITGTFIDPKQMYSEVDYPQVTVKEWVTEDGIEIKQDSSYRFVTSEFQSQRLANILLRRKRVGRTIELPLNMKGFRVRPGRYVKLTIKSLGIKKVEFRVTKWSFDPKSGINVTLRQDSVSLWDDAIGKPVERPDLTDLPTGGIAAPQNLRVVSEPVGEVVQALLQWTNMGTFVANTVVVRRGGNIVYTIEVPAPAQLARLQGLPFGDYTATVIAKAANGAVSPASGIAFTIAAPPVPIGAEITTNNNSITIIPKYSTANAYGTMCEFWMSNLPVSIAEVEKKATFKGVAGQFTIDGLRHGTTYHFYVRTINAYGKSAFIHFEAKTTASVTDILALLDNAITDQQLVKDLRDKIDSMLTDVEVGAIVDEKTETIIKDQEALAKKITQVEAKADGNTSAVQTVASAQAGLDKEVRSSWYTKAQINGVGGGFGLSVVLQPDGSVISQFVVDADIFAILAKGGGKINPFVVKNGVVYMNKAMMDNAEIGAVIAKYIDVKVLNAATINSSTINGGTISAARIISSGNPPTFELTTDGRLTARSANISGTINATSGEFRGDVYANNGWFKGTVYADKVEGDITKTYVLSIGSTLTIPAISQFSRYVSIPNISVSAAENESITIWVLVDGNKVIDITAGGVYAAPKSAGWAGPLPAGRSMTIEYRKPIGGEKGYYIPNPPVFVFKQ